MPVKVEPFSPDVLPHYDGQYRIFDKPGDRSITRPVKYATYTKGSGWAPAAPKLGWIGMSHRLSTDEIEHLRSQLIFWEPGAPNTIDQARKAVKLFRAAAQVRAQYGKQNAAQWASFYFQIAKSLIGVVQRSQEWLDDFPTQVDAQAQAEGAVNLDEESREAVNEAVTKFMMGQGRDLPPSVFRVTPGGK